MLVGVLLHRFGTVDEFELHGRGRELRLAGVLFATGGLLLSALPGVDRVLRKVTLDGGALEVRFPWLPSVFVISSILTGGAVLRAAGRVFLGWGASNARRISSCASRRAGRGADRARTTPPLMLIVPAALLLGAVVVDSSGLVPAIERAAARFTDHTAYATWVLRGHPAHYPPVPSEPRRDIRLSVMRPGARSARSRSRRSRSSAAHSAGECRVASKDARAALSRVRRLHSGHIGDYIAWWTAAAAMLGGASLILLT